MNSIIFVLIMSFTRPEIETLISKLNPSVSNNTKELVSETIQQYAPQNGFITIDDVKIILAVIQAESAFIHKKTPGGSGEWGMMQVIPTDAHIRQAARKYTCHVSDPSSICINGKPDILGSDFMVRADKLSAFIKESPRAGIAIGIMELAFWKRKYDAKLKRIYWDTQYNIPDEHKKWHKDVKRLLGNRVWVCHYNYGGTIKYSTIGKAYPFIIYKNIEKMEENENAFLFRRYRSPRSTTSHYIAFIYLQKTNRISSPSENNYWQHLYSNRY